MPVSELSVSALRERLSRCPLILDGGVATMLMRCSAVGNSPLRLRNFSPESPYPLDLLSLYQSDSVAYVHREYLRAGADIISTNTFNSNHISFHSYGVSTLACRVARAGAEIARKSVKAFMLEDTRRSFPPLVAGSMGPSSFSLSVDARSGNSSGVSPRNMADSFKEQSLALIEGGVDILLVETVYDLLNMEVCLDGISRAFVEIGCELPVMISGVFSPEGRLSSGHTVSDFINVSKAVNPLSLGINCVSITNDYTSLLRQLSAGDLFTSFHPNAGFPDKNSNYPLLPEEFADNMCRLLKSVPVNIIGGCCGTTPAHISLLKNKTC
ncbi:MAG: hypothetical protein HDS82_07650 [Bacteroidales bacterium]|nr:hypothetical protein [Bacteroidales bacterium]